MCSKRVTDTGTVRAAKLMERNNADCYEMWAAEMYIHRTVSGHPNIVELFDIYFSSCADGYDTANVAFVQQLCDHTDLFRHMQYYYDVNIVEAHNWMKDLRSALAHTHAYDIIHRDMKPSNCLLY